MSIIAITNTTNCPPHCLYTVCLNNNLCTLYRSSDFRPTFSRLAELRAFVPAGTPFMSCTATATRSVMKEVVDSLEMTNYVNVSTSPNRPNIYYEVKPRTEIESDFSDLLTTMKELAIKTPRTLIYCQSVKMCYMLFAHFRYKLGDAGFYPCDSPQLSDNRLFGMYHRKTPKHNQEVILKSLGIPDGVVHVVFAIRLPWEWGSTFRI